MAAIDRPISDLTGLEKVLILLPAAGGAVFGLLPLLAPDFLAAITGYPGNDHYIYRLAGSATFGYAVALVLGVLASDWTGLRLPLVATLTFNLASIFACIVEIAGGHPQLIVYAILVTSVLFVGLTSTLLYAHSEQARPAPDQARWNLTMLAIGTILALIFGLVPLLIPVQAGHLYGLQATDTFLFRQAGAASLGYGVMGIFMLRSRSWLENRWATVMADVFNGLAFLSSLVAILSGEALVLAYLVAAASLIMTAVAIVSVYRRGR